MVGKCLTESERNDVVHFLLENSDKGKLQRGLIKAASERWGVDRSRIRVLWNMAAKQKELGETVNVKSLRYGNNNKKRIMPDLEFIKGLDFSCRSTMERLAKKVGVATGTVHSWVVQGFLRPHTSALHPQLTDKNMLDRLKFCLNSLIVQHEQHVITFKDMENTVHIDEKWFYISRDSQRYYVVDGETLPYRSCKSKRYLTKVMFMCAVSRPLYNIHGELIFDGKIGIFPFTSQQPALRGSKNRPAGTLETKATESITKEVTKDCLINKIIPTIKAKWPSTANKHIYIQQDNAKPHIKNDDPDFRAAASSEGFNIELIFQPPNSPDLNTNDLGFFRALQSLQAEKPAKDVVELVGAVEKAFEEYNPSKLNKIFLSLQGVMVAIMKAKGHNNFAIPHLKKDQLLAQGLLPRNLTVDQDLVKECIDYMVELGEGSGLEELMEDMEYNL